MEIMRDAVDAREVLGLVYKQKQETMIWSLGKNGRKMLLAFNLLIQQRFRTSVSLSDPFSWTLVLSLYFQLERSKDLNTLETGVIFV